MSPDTTATENIIASASGTPVFTNIVLVAATVLTALRRVRFHWRGTRYPDAGNPAARGPPG